MNYSENNKTYGRKVIKKNKRKSLAAFFILFLIGFSIGSLMLSGIIHIVCCRCVAKVEANAPDVTSKAVVKVIEEPETINLGEYKLTAYCACVKCCGKTPNDVGYGITKSGVRAVEGVTVAADPKVIPMGTKIIIDGHEYTVQDTGGAIKGNRIDVYFDSHQDALEFGVQCKNIYTMKEGETNGEV